MKRYFLVLSALTGLMLFTVEAHSQNQNWGIGLRLGDPTGVSAKKYLGANNGLELALGSNLEGRGIQFLAHYLFHFPVGNAQGLHWYYGFGAQIEDHHHDNEDIGRDGETEFGADGVLGLEYTFNNGRLSAYLDGILFLEIIDDPFDLELDAGVGLRYNF